MQKFILALTFFTGFTGLIYEVVWQRYLANLIGSEARATALILAVFLGGLSLGYRIFGNWSRGKSSSHLIKMTGWIELGIGAWVLLFPTFFELLWSKTGVLSSHAFFSILFDVICAAVLIGLPTFLMGGTLPLLTQALSESLSGSLSGSKDQSVKIHAALYSTNTFGAFLGCLLGGFFFLPELGLPLSLLFMAPANIIAGALLVIASNNPLFSKTARAVSANSPFVKKSRDPKGATLSFLAGFTSLTLQSLVIRMTGIAMGASEYAFSMIVSVFIFLLAWGASKASEASDTGGDDTERKKRLGLGALSFNVLCICLGLVLIYWTIPSWGYASHVVRSLLSSVEPNFYLYHLLLFIGVSIILLPAVGAMGRMMPLLFGEFRNSMQLLGDQVGYLYGWNTLGCVAGALLGGYFFLSFVNLDGILRLTLLLSVASWALSARIEKNLSLKTWIGKRTPLEKGLSAVLLIATVLIVTPSWDKMRFALGTFRLREATEKTFSGPKAFFAERRRELDLKAYRDGPDASVGVIQNHPKSSFAISVSGKVDGDTAADLATVSLLAHFPGVFFQGPIKNVGVIGFGTGMTAGAFSLYPTVESIEVMEVNPFVREFAHYFAPYNHGITENPKFSWVMGDAYRTLSSSKKHYDIIVSEPSNPWVVGVERLFTQEFYRLVREKLTPRGIYSQWIHTYEVGEKPISIVIQTFASVFPHLKFFETQKGDYVILGSNYPFDGHSIETALSKLSQDQALQKDLARIRIHAPSDLFARELLMHQASFKDSALQTLDFPKLAYAAGFAFFQGKQGDQELQSRFETKLFKERAFQESLMKRYLSALPFEQAFHASCKTVKIEFFEGWKNASLFCQRLLFRGLVLNKIKRPSLEAPQAALKKDEIGIILEVLDLAPGKAVTLSKPEMAVKFYSMVDSEWVTTSNPKIEEATELCFREPVAKSECIVSAFEALLNRGKVNLVNKMLSKFTPKWKANPKLESFSENLWARAMLSERLRND